MLEREQKFYAYVVGADGKEYSITESIYSKTESAIEVIQKGKKYLLFQEKGIRNYLLQR